MSKIEFEVTGFWLAAYNCEYASPDEEELDVIGNIYENPELLHSRQFCKCKLILALASSYFLLAFFAAFFESGLVIPRKTSFWELAKYCQASLADSSSRFNF